MSEFFESDAYPLEPQRHSRTPHYGFPNYNEFARRGGADAFLIRRRDTRRISDDDDNIVGMELQWPTPGDRKRFDLDDLVLYYRLPKSRERGRHRMESPIPQHGDLVELMMSDTQKVFYATVQSIENNPSRPNTGKIVLDSVSSTGQRTDQPQRFTQSVKTRRTRRPLGSAIF